MIIRLAIGLSKLILEKAEFSNKDHQNYSYSHKLHQTELISKHFYHSLNRKQSKKVLIRFEIHMLLLKFHLDFAKQTHTHIFH